MKHLLLAAAGALALAGHTAHARGSLADQAMQLAIGAHLQTSRQFEEFFALVPAMSTCPDPGWHALLCSEEFEFKDRSTLEVLFVRVRNTYQLRPHACSGASFVVAAPR